MGINPNKMQGLLDKNAHQRIKTVSAKPAQLSSHFDSLEQAVNDVKLFNTVDGRQVTLNKLREYHTKHGYVMYCASKAIDTFRPVDDKLVVKLDLNPEVDEDDTNIFDILETTFGVDLKDGTSLMLKEQQRAFKFRHRFEKKLNRKDCIAYREIQTEEGIDGIIGIPIDEEHKKQTYTSFELHKSGVKIQDFEWGSQMQPIGYVEWDQLHPNTEFTQVKEDSAMQGLRAVLEREKGSLMEDVIDQYEMSNQVSKKKKAAMERVIAAYIADNFTVRPGLNHSGMLESKVTEFKVFTTLDGSKVSLKEISDYVQRNGSIYFNATRKDIPTEGKVSKKEIGDLMVIDCRKDLFDNYAHLNQIFGADNVKSAFAHFHKIKHERLVEEETKHKRREAKLAREKRERHIQKEKRRAERFKRYGELKDDAYGIVADAFFSFIDSTYSVTERIVDVADDAVSATGRGIVDATYATGHGIAAAGKGVGVAAKWTAIGLGTAAAVPFVGLCKGGKYTGKAIGSLYEKVHNRPAAVERRNKRNAKRIEKQRQKGAKRWEKEQIEKDKGQLAQNLTDNEKLLVKTLKDYMFSVDINRFRESAVNLFDYLPKHDKTIIEYAYKSRAIVETLYINRNHPTIKKIVSVVGKDPAAAYMLIPLITQVTFRENRVTFNAERWKLSHSTLGYLRGKLVDNMMYKYSNVPDKFKNGMLGLDDDQKLQVMQYVAKVEEPNKELDQWLNDQYPALFKKAMVSSIGK